jgi:hypothetical protein
MIMKFTTVYAGHVDIPDRDSAPLRQTSGVTSNEH